MLKLIDGRVAWKKMEQCCNSVVNELMVVSESKDGDRWCGVESQDFQDEPGLNY